MLQFRETLHGDCLGRPAMEYMYMRSPAWGRSSCRVVVEASGMPTAAAVTRGMVCLQAVQMTRIAMRGSIRVRYADSEVNSLPW